MALIPLATIALILAILVATLVGLAKVSLMQLSIYGAPLLLLSVHAIDDSWETATIIAAFTLLLLVGYWSAPKKHRDFPSTASDSGAPPLSIIQPSAPGALVLVASGFTLYHFAKVGVPILSANVESTRFDIGASGLFGLPSRMYLYGLPFAFAYSIASARARHTRLHADTWVRIAFIVLLASRIISRFKSGLIQFDTYVLVVGILASGGFRFPRYAGRIVAAAVCAVVLVFAVGSGYQSYQGNGLSLTQNIQARITSGNAEPVWIVANVPAQYLGESRSPLVLDAHYFGNRYFGMGPFEPYGFTRLVSAYWVHASPRDDRAYAPVTMTAAAVLWRQFHFLFLGLALLLGWALARLETAGYRHRFDPLPFAWATVGAIAILESLSRGEFVYAAINWTLSGIFLSVVHIFVQVVSKRGAKLDSRATASRRSDRAHTRGSSVQDLF